MPGPLDKQTKAKPDSERVQKPVRPGPRSSSVPKIQNFLLIAVTATDRNGKHAISRCEGQAHSKEIQSKHKHHESYVCSPQ